MSFMDLIKEKTCRIKQYVADYNEQQVVVLGGGNGAYGIVKYFRDNGVKNINVCVDDDYWEEGHTVLGYEVRPLSQTICSISEKIDVVVAIFDYDDERCNQLFEKYNTKINCIIRDDFFPHFWMPWHIFCVDRNYYEDHNETLSLLYDRLSDDTSRRVLISFIEQRISGKYKYSEGNVSNKSNQYFEPDIVNFTSDAILFDGGAYDGTDTVNFFDKFGENSFSYVIEPDPSNIQLIHNTLSEHSSKYVIVDKVLSDCDEPVRFSSGGETGSGKSDDGDIVVEGVTVDSIYVRDHDRFLNKKTILKMDIEGMELVALKGAERMISETKAALAICVYHKAEDIIDIPNYIMKMYPDYKLFLRRYENGFRDTVLYAIPCKNSNQ